MAKSVLKVKIISAGVLEILNHPDVAADLDRRAYAMHQALPTNNGEEWEVSSFKGRDRVHAVVKTANTAARRTNAEDNALIRATDAGR